MADVPEAKVSRGPVKLLYDTRRHYELLASAPSTCSCTGTVLRHLAVRSALTMQIEQPGTCINLSMKAACCVAGQLGILPEWKDGVPRGAYHRVVQIRIDEALIYLAPAASFR